MRRKLKLHSIAERRVLRWAFLLLVLGLAMGVPAAHAQFVDPIGLRLLRAVSPGLDGSGIRVAQPESGAPGWQVNPWMGRPGLPFRYESSNGVSTLFPNPLGQESGHADGVGDILYGPVNGVAPGIAALDGYEAEYFISALVFEGMAIAAKVVNQSFIIEATNLAEQVAFDRKYDDYSDRFKTLFVSSAGNGGPVFTPASHYNGIGVGAVGFGGGTSVGPTGDGGRSKPDMVAPWPYTSGSAPQIAGAAVLLLQAAERGDGGTNDSVAAGDIRVVKALLLNGAAKPSGWSQPAGEALDRLLGAGVLHAFNSWNQLRNGRHPVHETTIVPTTTSHPPGTATNRLAKLRGWAFASITNAQDTVDAVHHYYIDLPAGPASYVVTLTLTWHRRDGFSQANDLDLHFINRTTGASVGKSDTFANNVEHIHIPAVPPGSYDIQVLKNGGAGRVTPDELYALAIDASAATLRITTNPQPSVVEVRWPFTPPGLILETASQLGGNPVWSVVTGEPAIVGEEFVKTVASTNAAQFFRLRRP